MTPSSFASRATSTQSAFRLCGSTRSSARRGRGSTGGGAAPARGRAAASSRPSTCGPSGRRPASARRARAARRRRALRSSRESPCSDAWRRTWSRPVRNGSSAASWSAAPIVSRTFGPSSTTSKPPTIARPSEGGSRVVSMWTVVDLPAPFGPGTRRSRRPPPRGRSRPRRATALNCRTSRSATMADSLRKRSRRSVPRMREWSSGLPLNILVVSTLATPAETPTLTELDPWVRFLHAHATVVGELSSELVAEHGLTINDYEVRSRLSRAEGTADAARRHRAGGHAVAVRDHAASRGAPRRAAMSNGRRARATCGWSTRA